MKTSIRQTLLTAYAISVTVVAVVNSCRTHLLTNQLEHVSVEPDSVKTANSSIATVEVASLDSTVAYDWDKFITAVAWTESRHCDTAVSNKGAVGYLQIMPIYVAEVNRILGEDKYTLADRTNRAKSIEMFNILQNYHNPGHSIDRAIQLHNPRAGKGYSNEIKATYFRMLDEQS